MATDDLKFQIEEDGTVTIKSDEISRPNHVAAEGLLEFLGRKLGGGLTVTGKTRTAHTHTHGKLTHSH